MSDWIHSIIVRVTKAIRSVVACAKKVLRSALSHARDLAVALTRATGD